MDLRPSLRKFHVYTTRHRLYLVGRSKCGQQWRVLKFDRDATRAAELEIVEDPTCYTEKECATLLAQVHHGNVQHGGLKHEATADAVIGLFGLLEGLYLLVVTKKRLHGNICGRKVYGIAGTCLITLSMASASKPWEGAAERRYKRMMASIQLTKDFYFSYEYALWRTLQSNMAGAAPTSAFDSMFVWNEYLTRHLRTALGHDGWVTPLIHGFWQQRSLSVLGRVLTVTLIARRSKHFAGTRYRKRGVNDAGCVANEVETEQVVDAGYDWRTGFPAVASLVQVRGSIPLYWVQDTSTVSVTSPKPDIQLQQYDPLFSATRLHFQGLARRYGHPVVVLNLVKAREKRPRESILRTELGHAIAHLNRGVPEAQQVRHIPWDFKFHAKRRGAGILADLAPLIASVLDDVGLFVVPPAPPNAPPRRTAAAAPGATWAPGVGLQQGVLRTNCIDCLDRTNVAQFAAGLGGLGRQLGALGLASPQPLDPRSSAAAQLMGMYEAMGHALSRQYGGSEAHSGVFQAERGDWATATRLREKLTSLRRAINNGFYDHEKQDALNLFLGHYVPARGQPALWDLDSDHYLHSGLGRRSLLPSIPEAITAHMACTNTPTAPQVLASAASASPGAIAHLQRFPLPLGSPVAQASMALAPPAAPLQHLVGDGEGQSGPDSAEAAGNWKATGRGTIAVQAASLEAYAQLSNSLDALDGSGGDNSQQVEPRPSGKQPEGGAADGEAGEAGREALGGDESSLELRGLLGFRAPICPAPSSKLESFDRKIGRKPNALKEVCLHTPHPRAPYLPAWLASPLGMRRSEGSAHIDESSRSGARASQDSEASPPPAAPPSPPPPGNDPAPHAFARQAPNPFGQAAGVPFEAGPALRPVDVRELGAEGGGLLVLDALRDAADASGTPPAALLEGVRPLEPAFRPLRLEWAPRGCAGLSMPALKSAGPDGGVPSPPQQRRRLSFFASRLADALPRPTARAASLPVHPVSQPAGQLSREVRALDLAGLPSAERGLRGEVGASCATARAPDGLGLPRALALWWGANPPAGPCEAWAREEQSVRSMYHQYAAAVQGQLAEASNAALRARYTRLCRPGLAVSTEGFGPGTRGAAWACARGLRPAADYSAAALDAVAADLQRTLPPPMAAG